MPWTWIRPRDPGLLADRPLLDIGTGDGQSLLALTGATGCVVAMDASAGALLAARRSGVRLLVQGDAGWPPVGSGAFRVVLAADLLHHVDDQSLPEMISEVHRILAPGGRLVAWWYARPGRGGPDEPRYPRAYEQMLPHLAACGFRRVEPLDLDELVPGPETAGAVASR